MAANYRTALERIMKNVSPEPNSGCWLWTGRTGAGGYAVIGFYDSELYASRKRLSVTKHAHVVAYEILVGPVPEGMELDHLCRVRCCVNPTHLEPVTHAENVRRGIAGAVNGARERSKTHCKRGHPYSPENTKIRKNGSRACIACRPILEAQRAPRKNIGGKMFRVLPDGRIIPPAPLGTPRVFAASLYREKIDKNQIQQNQPAGHS